MATKDHFPDSTPGHERVSRLSREGQDQLGRSGLFLSAIHFHDASGDPFIGRVTDGGFRVIMPQKDRTGVSRNEMIGEGDTIEASLENTLEGMRSLETIRVRDIAEIEMGGGKHVSFAALEHYAPRMSPGRDIYPVSDAVQQTLVAEQLQMDTYTNTINQEGWQNDVRSVLNDYVTQTPDGQKLAEQLGIQSLDHVTPEQAIKLSVALVQNVSKYSWSDMVALRKSDADSSTTAELLREGIAQRDNPGWKGNGVCRNIASNVKTVFESLKATQDEMSMLRNTYATTNVGFNGQGYADTRDNRGKLEEVKTGHAWNVFTTVDRNGSAVATIVDVTSVLESDASSVRQSIDGTMKQTAAKLRSLVEKSESQSDALEGYREYIDSLAVHGSRHGIGPLERMEFEKFTLSEYLEASDSVQALQPNGRYLSDKIISTAYRLRNDLGEREVMTLLRLNRASEDKHTDTIGLIVDAYDKAHSATI